MFYLIFNVLVSCLSLKLLNFHIAWNCMHFLGYLLQHHNPHKTLCCLSSGTSLSESLKKGEIPCAEIVFESYTNHAGTILSPKFAFQYICAQVAVPQTLFDYVFNRSSFSPLNLMTELRTVYREFREIHLKVWLNCVFPQNFHKRKLGGITAFYAVRWFQSYYKMQSYK